MTDKMNEEKVCAAITQAGVKLFKDKGSGQPIAQCKIADRMEYFQINSRKFRGYILKLLREKNVWGGKNLIENVVQRMEYMAEFESVEMETYLRVANADEDIIYDLANDQHQSVRIGKDGWVIQTCNSPFLRYKHTQAQSTPEVGGDLDTLFSFLHIKPDDGLLLLGWLISCFIPGISHPILLVTGSRGSTKTSLTRILRDLVDPSATFQTSITQKMEDIILATAQNWCVNFDNVDYLKRDMSEFLCKVVTGDVHTTRTLFTNNELLTMQFKRCVLLNGISIPVQKTDLMSRILWIEMPPMSDRERKSETELFEMFHLAKPKILGAIFTLLTTVLRRRPYVGRESLHRLADFDLYGRAVALARDQKQTDFQSALQNNTERLHSYILTQDPVAQAVCAFMERRGLVGWKGTATALLNEITPYVHRYTVQSNRWPKNAATLSAKLDDVREDLFSIGIMVDRGHDGEKRYVELIPVRQDDPQIHPNTLDTHKTP